MKVVWSERAAERLEEIRRHVSEDDAPAADRLVERIIAKGEALRRFPKRGRPLREAPESECREVLEGRYRIVYLVRESRVEIVTVFHARQLAPWETE
jgi:plasmid stabilization system protein ParE